jgi:CRP-like cAMP-binding protein
VINDQPETGGTFSHAKTELAFLRVLTLLDRDREKYIKGLEHYSAGEILRNPAGCSQRQLIIVSGWACEVRIAPDGRREIFSFVLPGDAVNLDAVSDVGQRALLVLTHVEAVDVATVLPEEAASRAETQQIIEDAIQERGCRVFDQMVRLGRANAKQRVLNLLVEFHGRLSGVGLARKDTFRLPLTQEVFAEALGLSLVHVIRTLEQLRSEGHIVMCRGEITILRPRRLAETPSSHRPREAQTFFSAV